MDYTEISPEDWELLARDFLESLGFYVEEPPNRGADGGKDILVTEDIRGEFHRYRFRWLVSCKHFATSKKSVNENDDEINIQERLDTFNADGFIGFYSTLASTGLCNRLTSLRNNGKIKDYKIFDGRLIEHHLLTIGMSDMIMRYMPKTYETIRPFHKLLAEYIPLQCDFCGKDLLQVQNINHNVGIVGEVVSLSNDEIFEIYFSCKGNCDNEQEKKALAKYPRGEVTVGWNDVSDLFIPLNYLRRIMSIINQLNEHTKYSEQAIAKEKTLLMALGQKVLRPSTELEKRRVAMLASFEF